MCMCIHIRDWAMLLFVATHPNTYVAQEGNVFDMVKCIVRASFT